MKFIKKSTSFVLSFVLAALMLGTSFAAAAPSNDEVTITVLHTNDVHGAVVSSDSHAGLDYVAGAKKKMVQDGKNVLLVDAGDYSQGTPFVADSKGKSAITIMNKVGYDAVALGNHEFDWSIQQISDNLRTSTFDILNTNIKDDNSTIPGLSGLKISKVVTFGDVKVGIIGVDTPETYELAQPSKVQGLDFHGNDLAATVQAEVDKLKNESNCDVVIALTHLGDSSTSNWSSEKLAGATTGIDLIVDGHDHVERMGNAGDYDDSNNKGAIVVNQKSNAQATTTIVSTGTQLAYLGDVDITLNADKSLKSITSKGIKNAELLSNYTADEETKTVADQVAVDVNQKYAEVIGKAKYGLYGGSAVSRRDESSMADLVADSNRYHTLEWQKTADDAYKNLPVVGYINGGGVRASVGAGDITKLDVVTVLPFGNETRYLKMSYHALWEMVENGVSQMSTNDNTATTGELVGTAGRFFCPSGFSYEYDITKTPTDSTNKTMGSRVTKITLDDGTELSKDTTDQYVLIQTTAYEVGGGDGYYMCDPSFYNDGQVTVIGADNTNDIFLTDYIKHLMSLPENAEGISQTSTTGRIKVTGTGYTGESYTAKVKLSDSEGNGVSSAYAKVYIDGELKGEYTADADGYISVEGISNGLHDLTAVAQDGSKAADYVSNVAAHTELALSAGYAIWHEPAAPDAPVNPDNPAEPGNGEVVVPGEGEQAILPSTGDDTPWFIALLAA